MTTLKDNVVSEINAMKIDTTLFPLRNRTVHSENMSEDYEIADSNKKIEITTLLNEHYKNLSYESIKNAKEILEKVYIENSLNNHIQQNYGRNNIELITSEIIDVGLVQNNILIIYLPPYLIKIDLLCVINEAIKTDRDDIIVLLLSKNINFYEIKPDITIVCAEMKKYTLIKNLIKINISMNYMEYMEYMTLYILARDEQYEILQDIINIYKFKNMYHIAMRLSAMAIANGNINVLRFFFPQSAFRSIPDLAFCYFCHSIKFGHLPIIKYFVEGGISIKRGEYSVVKNALTSNQTEILEYFYQLDPFAKNISI